MNVKLLEYTPNPVELIYRAFKICYSKSVPTEIIIPKTVILGDYDIEKYAPDINKMSEFIKKYVGMKHESPLEHVSLTFATEGVSRALSHQLVRHRLASYNQQSQRYVKGENFDFIIPDTINEKSINIFCNTISLIKQAYKDLIEAGVPKEDARYILPNATTTNLIVTMNLREFRHFYAERSCKHAQWEIRELAEKMMDQVKEIIPFADYKAKKCGRICFRCKEV